MFQGGPDTRAEDLSTVLEDSPIFYLDKRLKPGDEEPTGHTKEVRCLAFTSDSRHILSGSRDHTIKMWDVETGRLVNTFACGSVVHDLAVSDGDLICALENGQVMHYDLNRLQDSPDGYEGKILSKHTPRANCVSLTQSHLSPRYAASGGDDERVVVVNLETRTKYSLSRKRIGSQVYSIDFSTDGQQIVFGCADGKIGLWELGKGRYRTVGIHSAETYCVRSFSQAQKRFVVSASRDQTVCRWQVTDPERTPSVSFEGHSNRVSCVAPLKHGGKSGEEDCDYILSGSYDCTVRVWDVRTGSCLRILSGHKKRVVALAVSPDGRWAASGAGNGEIILWRLDRYACEKTLTDDAMTHVYSLALTADGKTLVSASKDCAIRIWDLKQLSPTPCVLRKKHRSEIKSVAVTREGRFVLSGSADKTVWLWDRVSDPEGNQPEKLSEHEDEIESVAFAPDEKHIALASSDFTVEIMQMAVNAAGGNRRGEQPYQSAQRLYVFDRHKSRVNSVTFVSDKYVVSASDDPGDVLIWDIYTGEMLRQYDKHSSGVILLATDASGECVASCGDDKAVRVWSWKDLTEKHLYNLHSDDPCCVATHGDGKIVAVGTRWGTVRVFETGNSKALLKAHRDRVMSVAFSPGGKSIVSGSEDGTIKILDIEANESWEIARTLQLLSVVDPRLFEALDGEHCVTDIVTGHAHVSRDQIIGRILERVKDLAQGKAAQSPGARSESPIEEQIRILGKLGMPIDEAMIRLSDRKDLASLKPDSEEWRSVAALQNAYRRGVLDASTFYWSNARKLFVEGIIPETWTFELKFSGKREEGVNGYVTIDGRELRQKNRTDTAIRLLMELKDVHPSWWPLLKSIVLTLSSDRGDTQEVTFADFICCQTEPQNQAQPAGSHTRFRAHSVFKLDSGYRLEQEAILTVKDIRTQFEESLRPKVVEVATEAEESSLAGANAARSQLCLDIFNRFERGFKTPNIQQIRLRIGYRRTELGKLAENLMSKLIVLSFVPAITDAIYIAWAYSQYGSSAMTSEMVLRYAAYLFVLAISFALLCYYVKDSIRFWLRNRKKKGAR